MSVKRENMLAYSQFAPYLRIIMRILNIVTSILLQNLVFLSWAQLRNCMAFVSVPYSGVAIREFLWWFWLYFGSLFSNITFKSLPQLSLNLQVCPAYSTGKFFHAFVLASSDACFLQDPWEQYFITAPDTSPPLPTWLPFPGGCLSPRFLNIAKAPSIQKYYYVIPSPHSPSIYLLNFVSGELKLSGL